MSAGVINRSWLLVGQIALALVWLYEGLIAKILGFRADERAIVASVPGLPDSLVGTALLLLGLYEVGLAVLIMLGRPRRLRWLPKAAAVLQTVTLVAFNTGGLVFGRGEIAEPAHLLINNAALLALAWVVAVGLSHPAGSSSTQASSGSVVGRHADV